VGIHPDKHAGSEPGIDQLFAREPDGSEVPAPPALIFTEPIDSHEHQFADEAAVFAEERATAAGDDPLVLEADVRRAEAQAPADMMLRFFQVAAALVVFVGALFLFLMPDGSRREGLREPSGPRRLPTPASRTANATPPPDTPAQVETPPAEPARTVVPARDVSVTQSTISPREVRGPEPRIVQTSAPVRDTSAPSVSGMAAVSGMARATDAPVASPARPGSSAGAIPSLEVDRFATDAGSLIGAPVPSAPVPPVSNTRRPAAAETPAPAPAAASTPTGTSGLTAVDARAAEQGKVRALLSRYEAAYSDLDASAAASVYPSIDRKALSRAFDALESQQILFQDCRIQVANTTARATCAGTASWTPKVGTGYRQQARRWQFDLKQISGSWQIGNVQIQ
jgi:hypothetical protein